MKQPAKTIKIQNGKIFVSHLVESFEESFIEVDECFANGDEIHILIKGYGEFAYTSNGIYPLPDGFEFEVKEVETVEDGGGCFVLGSKDVATISFSHIKEEQKELLAEVMEVDQQYGMHDSVPTAENNLINKINSFRNLRKGWRGYDSDPISESLIEKAILISYLMHPDTFVSPHAGGNGIQFEVETEDLYLELNVTENNVSILIMRGDSIVFESSKP